jgi:2-(1,2-epoxy-1,2-dihydrophenyl)acetyl-CoA isomerase
MSDPLILLERQGPIARLKFNQPKSLNAISLAAVEALDDLLKKLSDDPEIRVLVISGEGRAFMAGGDLGYLKEAGPEGAPRQASNLITKLHATMERLTDLPFPVVASVHGAVAGAGISLMLACDFAIAADDCRFVFAYSSIAACPDGGMSWSLPRMLGLRRALDFAFLDTTMNAAEAERHGLVNRVVAPAELAIHTDQIAAKLAAAPTTAFRETRRLMRGSFERSWKEQLKAEHDGFVACTKTGDFHEGIAAFFDRRQASFKGR